MSRTITNTIVNDRGVYENLANRGDGYHYGSDDDSDPELDDKGGAEEGETDIDVTPKRKSEVYYKVTCSYIPSQALKVPSGGEGNWGNSRRDCRKPAAAQA